MFAALKLGDVTIFDTAKIENNAIASNVISIIVCLENFIFVFFIILIIRYLSFVNSTLIIKSPN